MGRSSLIGLLIRPCVLMLRSYPVDIFPPTDFHTSTYFADPTTGKEYIFIIGGLGYPVQSSRDRTDIYGLDLSDFSINRLKASGTGPPGGTYKHKAKLINKDENPAIRITTGEDTESSKATLEGKELGMTNKSTVFILRIRDMRWI